MPKSDNVVNLEIVNFETKKPQKKLLKCTLFSSESTVIAHLKKLDLPTLLKVQENNAWLRKYLQKPEVDKAVWGVHFKRVFPHIILTKTSSYQKSFNKSRMRFERDIIKFAGGTAKMFAEVPEALLHSLKYLWPVMWLHTLRVINILLKTNVKRCEIFLKELHQTKSLPLPKPFKLTENEKKALNKIISQTIKIAKGLVIPKEEDICYLESIVGNMPCRHPNGHYLIKAFDHLYKKLDLRFPGSTVKLYRNIFVRSKVYHRFYDNADSDAKRKIDTYINQKLSLDEFVKLSELFADSFDSDKLRLVEQLSHQDEPWLSQFIMLINSVDTSQKEAQDIIPLEVFDDIAPEQSEQDIKRIFDLSSGPN